MLRQCRQEGLRSCQSLAPTTTTTLPGVGFKVEVIEVTTAPTHAVFDAYALILTVKVSNPLGGAETAVNPAYFAVRGQFAADYPADRGASLVPGACNGQLVLANSSVSCTLLFYIASDVRVVSLEFNDGAHSSTVQLDVPPGPSVGVSRGRAWQCPVYLSVSSYGGASTLVSRNDFAVLLDDGSIVLEDPGSPESRNVYTLAPGGSVDLRTYGFHDPLGCVHLCLHATAIVFDNGIFKSYFAISDRVC